MHIDFRKMNIEEFRNTDKIVSEILKFKNIHYEIRSESDNPYYDLIKVGKNVLPMPILARLAGAEEESRLDFLSFLKNEKIEVTFSLSWNEPDWKESKILKELTTSPEDKGEWWEYY